MTSPSIASWRPLPQISAHAAFPGLCQLPDGRFLAVWRDAPMHTGGSDGKLVGSFSADGLKTWSTPHVIGDDVKDLRDPSVTVSRDGSKVWLTYFDYVTPSSLQCRALLRVSTDGGETFGDPVLIGAPTGSGFIAVCAPLIEFPDGELVVLGYGKPTGAETKDHALLFRSTDGGATWTRTTIANGTTANMDFQEPTGIILRNGALVVAMRYGTWDRIGMFGSWDQGRTFGALVPKFVGTGRPTLLEMASGSLLCFYRNPSNRDAAMRISNNRGGLWGAETIFAAAASQMTYVATLEMQPGLAPLILGIETNGSSSRLLSMFVRH